MKINIENFYGTDFFDIDLVQGEVGGGTISVEQIDTIRNMPDAESIIISGLDQSTFEYFIETYGNQFRAISFWKNKKVSDLSPLSKLENVELIHYFFNQRVTALWDMKKNYQLKGLEMDDFSKLHSIKGIECAPALEFFGLGNKVWAKMEIDTFQPITESTIKHFSWYGNKVADADFACLANSNIKVLDMSPCIFTMDELAKLLSLFPEDLEGEITLPYTTGSVIDADRTKTTYYFLCKGKKRCVKGVDDERIEKYLEEFSKRLKEYREERKI